MLESQIKKAMKGIQKAYNRLPRDCIPGSVLYNIFISEIPEPPDGDLSLYDDNILEQRQGRWIRSWADWGTSFPNGAVNWIYVKQYVCRLKESGNISEQFKIIYIPSGDWMICNGDRIKYQGVTFHQNFEF